VLEAARSRRFDLVASWDLAEEIAGVLRRSRIRRYGITEEDVEDVLFLLAPLLPSVEVESPVRDPGDAPVIAAAIHGRADTNVTGDADLLGDEDLVAWLSARRVEVLTPASFLERLGA
jgi:putative PIN family toxin of toxin-antitoxin system